MTGLSSPPRVLTAGEALIDLVQQPDGRFIPCNGGAVYNFTRALALQGTAVGYLNPFSSDRFGQGLRQGLLEAGAFVLRREPVELPTSLAVVSVDPQGKPDYAFYREAVADRALTAQSLIDATRAQSQCAAIVTGCLALAPADQSSYQPWLDDSRARGVLVAVDANLRPSVVIDHVAYRASVMLALGMADIIKASDDDLAALLPAIADPLQAALWLLDRTPARLLALTRGAQGALLMAKDGRRWHAREAAELSVVDTVGAGDCFLAGLMASALECGVAETGKPGALDDGAARDMLMRAVSSASVCVQRAGCSPPTADELERWMARGSVVIH